MRLLLTHGFFLSEDPKEQQVMRPYPPLGILYISAYLRAKGFDVDVYDSTWGSKAELYTILERGPAGWLGVYGNLLTRGNVIAIVERAKAAGLSRALVGLEMIDRGIARDGYRCLNEAGEAIGTIITDTVTVGTTTHDTYTGNNTATMNIGVSSATTGADLSVTNSGPATASAGNSITYSQTVTNNGPAVSVNPKLVETTVPG